MTSDEEFVAEGDGEEEDKSTLPFVESVCA